MGNKTLADPSVSLTLFAPSNRAVREFMGKIDTNLLLYHVLGAEVFSTDLKMGDNMVPTLDANKDVLDVIANSTGVFVKDVENREGQVELANIAGVNGVVHIINSACLDCNVALVVDALCIYYFLTIILSKYQK